MSRLQEILNIEQLAAFLSVPKATVYKLARDGKVPGHKVGRHWRFSRQAIRWWMEEPSPHANDPIQPRGQI
jgi:excisionase family DNA binding protein